MDKEIEKKILEANAAEEKLYKLRPEMKDPDWWAGDGCGDVELDEHAKQLQKELAEKAGIEIK